MDDFVSHSAVETHKHAASVAKKLRKPGCNLILLVGPMGAGKTEWVRGFAEAFLAGDSKKTVVTSPSYSVINIYGSQRKQLYHVDLFRVRGVDDLESIGFWDLLTGNNTIVVEWGEMLPPQWPESVHVLTFRFQIISETKRTIGVSDE